MDHRDMTAEEKISALRRQRDCYGLRIKDLEAQLDAAERHVTELENYVYTMTADNPDFMGDVDRIRTKVRGT